MLEKSNLIRTGKPRFQVPAHHVDEALALLGCYAVCVGICLLMFQDSLLVPSSRSSSPKRTTTNIQRITMKKGGDHIGNTFCSSNVSKI
jgi:hypothetical protein